MIICVIEEIQFFKGLKTWYMVDVRICEAVAVLSIVIMLRLQQPAVLTVYMFTTKS